MVISFKAPLHFSEPHPHVELTVTFAKSESDNELSSNISQTNHPRYPPPIHPSQKRFLNKNPPSQLINVQGSPKKSKHDSTGSCDVSDYALSNLQLETSCPTAPESAAQNYAELLSQAWHRRKSNYTNNSATDGTATAHFNQCFDTANQLMAHSEHGAMAFQKIVKKVPELLEIEAIFNCLQPELITLVASLSVAQRQVLANSSIAQSEPALQTAICMCNANLALTTYQNFLNKNSTGEPQDLLMATYEDYLNQIRTLQPIRFKHPAYDKLIQAFFKDQKKLLLKIRNEWRPGIDKRSNQNL